MPWDTKDYPSSLKNLDNTVRKKAIDIANAMIDEGYQEGRAIPIATEQAKEWYKNATDKEINEVKQMSDEDLRSRGANPESSRPELLKKGGEHVLPHDDGWAVKSEAAKQASDVYSNKQDAINRAKEIANNKQTNVIIHKKDGTIQKNINYE
ncbi:hypothetical protein JCM21714_2257 [Gracilibacillus boraciitolerans JCM 21714]|uniref:DUF2188 domain-containing protein n=1 Tax=Gracilibacillus boraciitolerans JCM 21714 TaxID=1298598 RepID=W4VK53_9BACI|nr:DUF2188 domain-containing protein [Gracilibacillus boraciitolerans]GAE93203.1 hypothetical protein JCM21714_2257 [Gracilibacillus boraciitolerans JCM 21714]